MFYDLQNPRKFVSDIRDCLHKNGFWHFEQSYLYSMLSANSYDTICHEHLEYYSMKAVKYLLELEGMKIVDVELNRINGGSFAVTATHSDNPVPPSPLVDWLLESEETNAQAGNDPLSRFLKPYLVIETHSKIFLDACFVTTKQSGDLGHQQKEMFF